MLTNTIKFFIKIFYKVFYSVEVIGEEKLPINKGYVICANHISNHDPTVYAASVKKLLYAVGKKELFSNFLTRKLFEAMNTIPVNREALDINALKKSLRVLKKEKAGLLIFPEQTRNFGKDPLPVSAGVSMLAIKAKVPVVPVAIDSSYKLFSKVIIRIMDPIDLSEYYGEKLHSSKYKEINEEIINLVYSKLELYKYRSSYEGDSC